MKNNKYTIQYHMMNDDDILWEIGYQGILDFKVSAHVEQIAALFTNTIGDAPQVFNWNKINKIRYLHLKHISTITAYLCLIIFFRF